MENAYNPNQSLQVLGASIGFGKRLNKPDNWFQLYLSANYNLYMLNDWIYDTFRGFHNGNANDISFQLRFSRTSIDNPVFTRRGSDFSLSVTATPPYSLFDKRTTAIPVYPLKSGSASLNTTSGASVEKYLPHYSIRLLSNIHRS